MRTAYFDCFAGAGGDMIVGALLDAGADFDALRDELGKLHVGGYSLGAERQRRGGLAGTKFSVTLEDAHQPHRGLNDILELIGRAGLAERVAERASDIFRRLGAAEAKVHDIPVEEVHFHEVGAIDSILDVVGACVALELLGIDRVLCSPIPPGSGTVRCEHGVLPVPAPATAELLAGAVTAESPADGELTTPTAAAILTTLSDAYAPCPPMQVAAIGCGAGTRELEGMANLLRVVIGQADAPGELDSVVQLDANLDDCTGEVIGAAIDRLLAAGALDAWATPAVMKKSRPGWVLSVLAVPADAAEMERIVFIQTTTFGVRRRTCRRATLIREHRTVETRYGPVRIKVGRRDRRVVSATPEFADCASAADAHHVAVREVLDAARQAWRTGGHES